MIKINDELYRSVDIHKFIDLKYSDSENIDGINARLKADVIDDIKTFEKMVFALMLLIMMKNVLFQVSMILC